MSNFVRVQNNIQIKFLNEGAATIDITYFFNGAMEATTTNL
jgi:hypothetical protein